MTGWLAAEIPTPVSSAVDPVSAAAAVVLIVVTAGGLTWALLLAAKQPHPVAMVTALALLTLLSLLGLAITSGEPASTFGTLAATGMGALAGAVTATFQSKNDDDTPRKEPADDDTDG